MTQKLQDHLLKFLAEGQQNSICSLGIQCTIVCRERYVELDVDQITFLKTPDDAGYYHELRVWVELRNPQTNQSTWINCYSEWIPIYAENHTISYSQPPAYLGVRNGDYVEVWVSGTEYDSTSANDTLKAKLVKMLKVDFNQTAGQTLTMKYESTDQSNDIWAFNLNGKFGRLTTIGV